MAIYTGPEHVAGVIASVNPKGVRLDGHDSWMNFSKFADIVPPERGQAVSLTLDRQGFVRAIEIAEADPGAISGQNGRSRPATEHRDRTITRLAILKAAAEFGAARPQLRSGEVLKIAASWERWVNRESAAEDEIVDAF